MEHPGFFERAAPKSLGEIARATGAELADPASSGILIETVRTLADAGTKDITFLDNKKYLSQLSKTAAAACLVKPAYKDRIPSTCAALITDTPYHGFALALQLFYPGAMQTNVASAGAGAERIDPSAQLEDGVELEPGVIIGPEARIGRGTRIAAGAVIGARVHIGRDSYIGALASITHALVGNHVIIHAGVRIGQDGFGFAMGPQGHLKVPQIGRVIIQDHVELGANTTVDRGALNDTMIGEGTKIDNLVQIGHNAIVGRHCVIVSQSAVAGSTELGDFVVMGGHSGAIGHIKIGAGAQIAGASHVKDNIPPGARMGGTPARPFNQWAKELAILARMAKQKDRS